MDDFTPKILYEDSSIAVCLKPAGMLSESGTGGSFPDALSAWYRSQGKKSDIFTVHRLDRVVGGVMVFSRRKDVTGKLTAAVAERKITKEYLAVLQGVPEEAAATLEDLLFRDASKGKSFVVKRMRKGVRDASLDYHLLGTAQDGGQALSLVRVRLHTGRTHQIRVQFASRKLPLLGDGRYGSRSSRCETALWSWHLGFCHPVSGKPMDFYHLPPDGYPWNFFAEMLPK